MIVSNLWINEGKSRELQLSSLIKWNGKKWKISTWHAWEMNIFTVGWKSPKMSHFQFSYQIIARNSQKSHNRWKLDNQIFFRRKFIFSNFVKWDFYKLCDFWRFWKKASLKKRRRGEKKKRIINRGSNHIFGRL